MKNKSAISKILASRKASVGLLIFLTVGSFYDLGFMIDLMPDVRGWVAATIARGIEGLLFFVVIWFGFKRSRSRLKVHRMSVTKWFVVVGLLLVIAGPNFQVGDIPYSHFWRLMGLLLFSLGIGVSEEFFSRGLIFSIFERFGLWFGVAVSSISFGAIHLGNVMGGQEWPYTIMQSVNAASMGMILIGLVIFTGSIWFSVLLHAAVDMPLVTIKGLGEGHIDFGLSDFAMQGAQSLVAIAIGVGLIYFAKPRGEFPGVERVIAWLRIESVARRFKLIDD